MDLENANELLKNLLFPGGKFDPKGYQQLAEWGIVSEREDADAVLQAPTKSTADRIRENTEPRLLRAIHYSLQPARLITRTS